MNAFTHPLVTLPAGRRDTLSTALRIFLMESRSEFLRLVRAPAFSVPTIAFPLMFYALFGILIPGNGHPENARHALAAFLVIGTMGPGLFALGITLAVDRERGLMELKRALPMPAGIFLAAKLAMSMLFAAIVAGLIMLMGALVGQVVLTVGQWSLLLALAMLGVLPFCAMGLLVGALVKASAAPAVLNLIYLPMSFLSGLWVPLGFLPHGFRALAPCWPAWHLAQLALAAAGLRAEESPMLHLAALAGIGGICFAIARGRLARPH